MLMLARHGLVLIFILACCGMAAADDRFEAVAAIFESNCVGCHTAEKSAGGLSIESRDALLAGGESGEVIAIGRPEDSLLVDLISGTEPSMPKAGKGLNEEEVESIRHWIAAGAPWPAGRKLEDRSLASKDWWSLRPLKPFDLPAGMPADEANPIDRFVRAKLRDRGLDFSPEADRPTLIRRLAFDLIGLPPTIEEIEKFCSDTDSDAYEKLVNRLLASPRYGERWARHWLDVVHYGETHGYDKDQPRPNAWPYRDYVIRAFNEDKPYDRFVQEQIAGDILFPETVDGIVALGFIAAGPWDFIGHAELPESKIDGKIARHLDRDDMVSNTINTFQSITVHCAQCHNHRFDPVSQEDYYALQANFAALDRADRKYYADVSMTRQYNELIVEQAILSDRQNAIEKEAAVVADEELKAIDEAIALLDKQSESNRPEFGYHSEISTDQDTLKWVQVDLGRTVVVDRIVLKPAYDDFNNIGAGFGFPIRFKIEISDDPEFKSGNLLIVSQDQSDVANPGIKVQSFSSSGASGRYVRMTASKLAPRQEDFIFALAEMEIFDRLGKNVAAKARVTAFDSIESLPRWSKIYLVDSISPEPDRQNGLVERKLRRSELIRKSMNADQLAELESIKSKLAVLADKLSKLPDPSIVYAGTVHTGSGNFVGTGANGGRPRTITVLDRGDVNRPGQTVLPGALSCVSFLPARFDLPVDASEGDRRVALARWLSDARNPLTWRSIVNRVWQYHFGRGIVETPNDFGRMGAEPTHPELLDWLAVWFRDEAGGSLKQLHRLIVTSQTYRQTSSPEAELMARAIEFDSSNALLWRQNRRKLEAEAIRDSILLVAGKLDLTMGGPSFQDFVITHPEHSPHYQYHLSDPEDPRIHRRSIYRFIVRSQQQPWMAALDCADPSMLVDRRNETITPLQALAQLNNQLSIAMATHFAARVTKESSSLDDQINNAYRMALQRLPTDTERTEVTRFAREHGLENTCRLLMNLNEFVFVD
jgi:mono/diheme cytochrome c family protein